MVGNNTLVINQATMRTAIEYYLNEVVFNINSIVKVVDVSGQTINNHCPEYKVTVESPDPDDKPVAVKQ